MTPRRLLLVPLGFLASVHASAQQRDTAAQLAGVVFSAYTGRPLAGATVETPYGRATTDAAGRFALSGQPPGNHPVLVSYRGHYSQELTARLKRGHTLRWTVVLNPDTEAVQLPPILVEAEGRNWRYGLAGFYERAGRGMGQYYTYELLERRGSLPLRVLLEESGVALRCTVRGCVAVNYSGLPCAYNYYEDGFLTPFEDINRVRASDLAGVEIYSRGTRTPFEFLGVGDRPYEKTCGGVVAVWSRYLN